MRRLTVQEMSTLLPALLPAAWRGAATVQWAPGQRGQPTEAWLEHIWAKLQASTGLQNKHLSVCSHGTALHSRHSTL